MSDFDFSKVEAAENSKFLTPGNYNLAPIEAKYETPEGKTPFLQISFSRI